MASEDQITCQEFVELVTDYLEHTLLPEIRSTFEQHAATCPGCNTYLDQIQQTIGMLHLVADEPLSAATRQKILEAFGQWKQELKGKNT